MIGSGCRDYKTADREYTTNQEGLTMARVKWQERIIIAPDLHHGDPCIKGTRIPVSMIVGSLAEGMTSREIREEYPQLVNEDIRAALAYSAESLT
jgi:uncharacterized protein (DUF433 family)